MSCRRLSVPSVDVNQKNPNGQERRYSTIGRRAMQNMTQIQASKNNDFISGVMGGTIYETEISAYDLNFHEVFSARSGHKTAKAFGNIYLFGGKNEASSYSNELYRFEEREDMG